MEPAPEPLALGRPTEESARELAAARSGLAPELMGGQAGGQAAAADGELALDAAAGLLRGRRAIGFGSPRASLEANYALRALVGPANFYLGISDGDDRLVGAVLEIAADPRLRLGSAADVHDADAVLVLGEDLTNTAPMLDLTIRTWLHLRPNAVEERNHIRRWNDAGITRIKRREPSALWIATTHATKLDAVAAETHRAAPDDLVRLALAIAHEVDDEAPRRARPGRRRARGGAALGRRPERRRLAARRRRLLERLAGARPRGGAAHRGAAPRRRAQTAGPGRRRRPGRRSCSRSPSPTASASSCSAAASSSRAWPPSRAARPRSSWSSTTTSTAAPRRCSSTTSCAGVRR